MKAPLNLIAWMTLPFSFFTTVGDYIGKLLRVVSRCDRATAMAEVLLPICPSRLTLFSIYLSSCPPDTAIILRDFY